MNVEIRQCSNGWMVRKIDTGRDHSFVPLTESMVFNKFEDLCEYLRTLSGLTK